MGEDNKTVDYMASINKARRRKKRPPYGKYAAIAVGVIFAAGAAIFGGKALKNHLNDEQAVVVQETEAVNESVAAISLDPVAAAENEEEAKRLADIEAVIDSYTNLGIVKVTGYLNIRETPEAGEQVVGKLMDGSACEILETLDGWYHITSGEIEGYISADYVLTGDEAVQAARELVKNRAVVTTDNLNIRKEPTTESDIVGQCLEGEKYEILEVLDGWYQIPSGYISADYADTEFSLNEARKLDMRAMVLNYYDNPGVSNVTNYLNIRQKPDTSEKVIGKLPSYAGCEILEEADGWY